MRCPVRWCEDTRGPAGAFCLDCFRKLPTLMQIELEQTYLDEGPTSAKLKRLKNDALMFIEGAEVEGA